MQVYKELYTYDAHANTSIHHYWMNNGEMDGSFYASTPSFAHDANATFFVSIDLYSATSVLVIEIATSINIELDYMY